MAVVYTLTSNQANSRKTQAAEARQDAERYEARVKQQGVFGSFAAIKQTRVASVKQLATSRFDWERYLRELSAILPRGSWIQETNASVTGEVESEGGASTSSTSGGATGQPSAKLLGCTPRQGDTAKLMVRLRKMYLVDDVTLNESTQGESNTPPTVENCGRLWQFDLTVTFKAAAPTGDEAPPNRKQVPVSLGGGS
jgi:hypothetical protein